MEFYDSSKNRHAERCIVWNVTKLELVSSEVVFKSFSFCVRPRFVFGGWTQVTEQAQWYRNMGRKKGKKELEIWEFGTRNAKFLLHFLFYSNILVAKFTFVEKLNDRDRIVFVLPTYNKNTRKMLKLYFGFGAKNSDRSFSISKSQLCIFTTKLRRLIWLRRLNWWNGMKQRQRCKSEREKTCFKTASKIHPKNRRRD